MRLNEITVADQPDAWRAIGFTVEDGRVRIGDSFVIHLTGAPGGGITSWTLGIDGLNGASTTDPGGMKLTVTDAARPTGTAVHENGVSRASKAVILTADTTASIARLREATADLGAPENEGKGSDGAHYAIWPMDDTEVGLEVVCLDPDQGNDAMQALFLVVDDFDAAVERVGKNDVTPEDVYSERRRVIIKPRIGVTAGVHLLSRPTVHP